MAMTIVSQSNAETITNIAVLRVTTDAATAAAVTIALGFTPRVVRVHNLTDRISDEWFEGMAAASSLHTVAAGTRTLELVDGITVNPRKNDGTGDSITLDATTMVASKVFVIEALG